MAISPTPIVSPRILMRGLQRLPHQTREDFLTQRQRLKESVEQFNRDVAAMCKWLFRLQKMVKGSDGAMEPLWKFFFHPHEFFPHQEEGELDRIRRQVFDLIYEWDESPSLTLPPELSGAIERLKQNNPLHLFPPDHPDLPERLKGMRKPHRMVILQSAADWVNARYLKALQKWEENCERWEKEKKEWEENHPQLTPEIREKFNQIFQEIGIKIKNPRICLAKDLLPEIKDDCRYSGESLREDFPNPHSPLCKKYWEFLQGLKGERFEDEIRREFIQKAQEYLRKLGSEPRLTIEDFYLYLKRKEGITRSWLPQIWSRYIEHMGLSLKTLLASSSFPHCTSFSKQERCQFNPHTEKCREFRDRLLAFKMSPEEWKRDEEYREWRKLYLVPPRRPQFVFPSTFPSVAKIFGRGLYEVDWERSVVRLRLDDMPEGSWLEFGFTPWPKDYPYKPSEYPLTSVQIHFIGSQGRVGFNFSVPSRSSPFTFTQEELNDLRNRKFRPTPYEREFPKEVREFILQGFKGKPEDLRICAVDIGLTGAYAVLFVGNNFRCGKHLPIVKREKLYEELPKELGEQLKKSGKGLGLSKEHQGLHIKKWAEAVKEITEYRQTSLEKGAKVISRADLRRLSLHMSWMIRDWARLNASQIVKLAKEWRAHLILLESEQGSKAAGREVLDKEHKRRFAFFPYGKIRRIVAYKAEEMGMRMVTTPYYCSSQVCSICNWYPRNKKEVNRLKKEKNCKVFICKEKSCKSKLNSDENAARVIARVFWGEIILPKKES